MWGECISFLKSHGDLSQRATPHCCINDIEVPATFHIKFLIALFLAALEGIINFTTTQIH